MAGQWRRAAPLQSPSLLILSGSAVLPAPSLPCGIYSASSAVSVLNKPALYKLRGQDVQKWQIHTFFFVVFLAHKSKFRLVVGRATKLGGGGGGELHKKVLKAECNISKQLINESLN